MHFWSELAQPAPRRHPTPPSPRDCQTTDLSRRLLSILLCKRNYYQAAAGVVVRWTLGLLGPLGLVLVALTSPGRPLSLSYPSTHSLTMQIASRVTLHAPLWVTSCAHVRAPSQHTGWLAALTLALTETEYTLL